MSNQIQRPVLGVSCLLIHDNKFLLAQRGKPPSKGLWSLPGGKVEWGEMFEDAAKRELIEETAITPPNLHFGEFVEIVREEYHYVIGVFAGRLDIHQEAIAGDDAAAVGWFTSDELDQLDADGQMTPTTRDRIRRLSATF